jgi:hypothetical protein
MAASDIRAGRAFVELSVKNNLPAGMAKALSSVKQQLQAFGAGMTAIGSSVFRMGAGVATAFAAIGTSLFMPIRAAGDLMETTSKFGSVFGAATAGAQKWADEFAAAVGRSRSETMNSMAALQAFFTGLGMGADQASKFAKDLTALSVDFASFHNISDPEAMQRFISALSGSGEVLDMFGINIKESALNLKLLSMGFPSIQKGATETQKVLARMAIIRESMGRQGAVGDAIKTAGSFSNQLKALYGSVKNTAEAFGNDLLPVVTPLITRGRAIVEAFGAWIKTNGGLAVSIGQIAVAGTAAGAAIATVGAGLMAFGAVANGAAAGLGVLRLALVPAIQATNLFNSTLAGVQRIAVSVGTGIRSIGATIGSGMVSALNVGRSGLLALAAGAQHMATSVISAAISAGSGLYAHLATIAARIPAAFSTIVAGARGAFAGATSAAKQFGGELQYWIGRPLTYFKTAFPILAADLATGMSNAMIRIRGIATTAADGVRAAWGSVSARISGALAATAAAITARLGSVTSPLAQAWGAATSAISARASAAWTAIAGSANSMLNRIKQRFGSLAPLIGQDLGRLAGYASAASSAVVGAFRAAGPAIARGLVSAATGAFARIRAMGSATAGAMGRGIGAGARGLGGAVSGIAGLLSMIGGSAGGMLGQIAAIVPSLLAIGGSLVSLLNPATLLIAAIAGGVYLWTQYSESGKAALAQVMAVMEPFVNIAKQTFGGVYDAIKAGDLALAGKIAMAGLKLAFVTGMENLGNLIGGTWGKAVKDIGGKIAGGDFKGAWQTAVKFMASIWDSWSQGIVKTFTGAISRVVGAWKSGVEAISNFLLEASAAGGALGTIASGILGVDMKDAKQHSDLMEQAGQVPKIRNQERQIADQRQIMETAKAAGNQALVEKMAKSIEMGEKALAELRGGKMDRDFMQQAKEAAAEFTASTKDGIEKVMGEMNRDAEIKANESNKALADLLARILQPKDGENIAKAQAKLDALLAEAKKKREEKSREINAPNPAAGGADGEAVQQAIAKNTTGATFSAAAAIAMGRGGTAANPQERVAKAAERQVELLEDQKIVFKVMGDNVGKNIVKMDRELEILGDIEREIRELNVGLD